MMFDLRPSSPSLDQIREIEQQNTINFLQMMQGREDVFHVTEMVRFLFEKFFPNENPERFIKSEEQLQQQLQQHQPGQAEGLSQEQGPGQPTINPQDLVQRSLEGRLGGRQGF